MRISEIINSVTTIPKIGHSTEELLKKLNIFTIADLLQFYPRDYDDRTQKISLYDCINAARSGQQAKVHTIAQVTAHDWFGYGTMKTLKIIVTDGTAQAELVAFNRPWLEKSLRPGCIIALDGIFAIKFNSLQSSQFEATKLLDNGKLKDFIGQPIPNSKVIPIYRQTEGLTSKQISSFIEKAFAIYSMGIDNDIPDNIIEKNALLQKRDALRKIHFPSSLSDAIEAKRTLVYEELFLFQKQIAELTYIHKGELPKINEETGLTESRTQRQFSDEEFESTLSPRQKQLLERLPFSPTDDQKSVIAQMNLDIDKNYESAKIENQKPYSMRTLLQGDVGSGKTLVSFFAALRVIDYGGQCALMAPTELLARQHAENAAKQLEVLNVKVAFLTGNLNAKGRKPLLESLKSGEINLVIGTHALFSKSVIYKDLSLVIIDEQHRFGVVQRSAILQKGRTSTDSYTREPNLLMMSATPIPQTLALTVFGDLDVLSIHTMPNGRKPIRTFLTRQGNESNVYEAVRSELRAGHQAYFVYPSIESSESALDTESEDAKSSLKSAEEMFNFLKNQVYPEFNVGLVHGRVDEEETAQTLNDFRTNKIQILVATTVVEVGVDVPNATCIVIEQADCFGLAGLHQLRGRVGRGDSQSYCFLIYRQNISENGIARMKALRETTDGFKIAEEDLKLRGPGEITGTAQSGELSFKIADPSRDEQTMIKARIDAFEEVKKQIKNYAT